MSSQTRPTLPQQLLEPEEWAAFAATYSKIGEAFRALSMLRQRLDDGGVHEESYAIFVDYFGGVAGLWMAVVDQEEYQVTPAGYVSPSDLQFPAEAEMRIKAAIEARDRAREQRQEEYRRRSAVLGLPHEVYESLYAAVADPAAESTTRESARTALRAIGTEDRLIDRVVSDRHRRVAEGTS